MKMFSLTNVGIVQEILRGPHTLLVLLPFDFVSPFNLNT